MQENRAGYRKRPCISRTFFHKIEAKNQGCGLSMSTSVFGLLKTLISISFIWFYSQAREEQEKKEKEMQKTTPHFWNLNEDSQLSGKVLHFIKPGN